jgi:hypothetical protein
VDARSVEYEEEHVDDDIHGGRRFEERENMEINDLEARPTTKRVSKRG